MNLLLAASGLFILGLLAVVCLHIADCRNDMKGL